MHTFSYILITCGILSIFFADKTLATYIATSSVNFQSTKVIAHIFNPAFHILGSMLIALIALYYTITEKTIYLYACAQTLAGIFVQAGKHFFGRVRPLYTHNFEPLSLSLFNTSSIHHSLPSGHSCVLGILATFLSLAYPRYRTLFFAVALLLAFTRTLDERHFLSDIFFGLAIGILTTLFIYNLLRRYIPHLA